MSTRVCGMITFLDDTGTVRRSLIRYMLLTRSLSLRPCILLQLNVEKNDTLRALIGLKGPDKFQLDSHPPYDLSAPIKAKALFLL